MQRRAGTSAPGPGVADAMLAWYDRDRRELPWRARPASSPILTESG